MPNNNEGVVYTNPPQSRNEAILEAGLSGTPYTDPPQSRIEDLLIQWINKGGGGGTTVIANPQLTGGEADLESIKIDGTNYRLVPENVIRAIYNLIKFATFAQEPSAEDFGTIEDYLEESVVTLSNISATKTITSYVEGSQLNTSDVLVTAQWSNGTSSDVTESAIIDTSQVDMTTEGTYSIGVSYTANGVTKTTNITITVIAASTRTITPLGTFQSGALPNPTGTPHQNPNACELQNISLQNGQKIGFKNQSDYSTYRFAFGYGSSNSSWIKDPNDSNYWTTDAEITHTASTYGVMILHVKAGETDIPITAEDIAYISQNFGTITEA